MHALPDSSSTSQGASVHLVSGDSFGSLEAKLSHAAKHAYETFQYAFWLPGQSMTMGEIRDALRRLYGDAVDRELEQHFFDRQDAASARRKCECGKPHYKTTEDGARLCKECFDAVPTAHEYEN